MTWAPAYVTTAELDAFLRITDTVDDVELGLAIDAASRAVDSYAGRQFGKVAAPEVRLYTAEWNPRRGVWAVDIDDLQDLTGLTVTIAAGPITDFALKPANFAAKGKPYTLLVVNSTSTIQPCGKADELTITAAWGWNAVPTAVKLAAKLQASRFAVRRNSPYGIAGSPDQGNEMRLLARIDPDVGVSLYPYKRQRKVR